MFIKRVRESQSGGESHRLLQKPYCAEFSALLRIGLDTSVFWLTNYRPSSDICSIDDTKTMTCCGLYFLLRFHYLISFKTLHGVLISMTVLSVFVPFYREISSLFVAV
jgi:hypothetical protein